MKRRDRERKVERYTDSARFIIITTIRSCIAVCDEARLWLDQVM